MALFHDKQIVVFLAALGEDVLVVEQHIGAGGHVGVGQFLLVDAHAATLCEFAHLALAGEHCGILHEQVDERCASLDKVTANLELWHAFEHRQQRVLVDAVKDVLGLVREASTAIS